VSTGAKATLTDLGAGKWKVTFPGITAAYGAPAATVGNDVPGGYCNVDSVNATASAASVTVHCMDRLSHAVKSSLTVSYTTNPGAIEGWAYADQPTHAGPYTPTTYYDAAGGAVTADHFVGYTGEYVVTFPGVVPMPYSGAYTVNAIGPTQNRCEQWLLEFNGPDVSVYVLCYAPGNTLVDTPFVVHSVGHRPLLNAATPQSGWAYNRLTNVYGTSTIETNYWYTSNDQPITVKHTALGVFKYTFPGLAGTTRRMVHVTTDISADGHCNGNASASNGNAIVTVKCFNYLGTPYDMGHEVIYEAV
jgi:hypothetical protein